MQSIHMYDLHMQLWYTSSHAETHNYTHAAYTNRETDAQMHTVQTRRVSTRTHAHAHTHTHTHTSAHASLSWPRPAAPMSVLGEARKRSNVHVRCHRVYCAIVIIILRLCYYIRMILHAHMYITSHMYVCVHYTRLLCVCISVYL